MRVNDQEKDVAVEVCRCGSLSLWKVFVARPVGSTYILDAYDGEMLSKRSGKRFDSCVKNSQFAGKFS
jgi:hypothetical protein